MKPLAFRIKDFRSITDSGICDLSGDNVTILAGQNEAGKSAVLMALRDFDLENGEDPETEDYFPEGKDDAQPSVAVFFRFEDGDLETLKMPELVLDILAKDKGEIWITRDLKSGQYKFKPEIEQAWGTFELLQAAESPAVENVAQTTPAPTSPPVTPAPDANSFLTREDSGEAIRQLWPQFFFFDTFKDQLPRTIAVEPLETPAGGKKAAAQTGQGCVEDYLELSGVSTRKVLEIKNDDKALNNYLRGRSANVTGDFLTYWKQPVDGKQQVELSVKHHRTAAGVLQFAFYVTDGTDQYPEQRSKGFLWFLSFYLKLAAEEKRAPSRKRLLLIDEPGTYLHATAQRDVLHLIEHRLAKSQHVIYSTHSPYLIPQAGLHRLRIVIRDGGKGTIVVDRLTHPALRGASGADALSPVITAIGLDLRERLAGISPVNLLVEGITDCLYLNSWRKRLDHQKTLEIAIIPGTGGGTLPTLGSLLTGWGLKYAVLLDRDAEGNKQAKVFERDLLLAPSKILQTPSAEAIEDVFDRDDFANILKIADSAYTIQPGETPVKAIKRQGINKVLLAQKFAESNAVFSRSEPSFRRVLDAIATALS